MKCPHCAAPAPDGAAECPACGVIVAKFLAQREKERKEAQALLERGAEAPSKPWNPWIGRSIAGALVGLWLIGLYWYFVETLNDRAERLQRVPKPAPVSPAPAR